VAQIKDLNEITALTAEDSLPSGRTLGQDNKISYPNLQAQISASIPVSSNANILLANRMTIKNVTPADMTIDDLFEPSNGEPAVVEGELIFLNNYPYSGIYQIQATGAAIRYSKASEYALEHSLIMIKDGLFEGQIYQEDGSSLFNRVYLPTQELNTTSTPTFATLTTTGLATLDTAKIGDVAGGDYTEFEANGTLKFNGASTTWEDENFDPTMLTGNGNLPSLGNFGSTTISISQFSGSQTDEVLLCKEYPHKAKLNATGETSVKLSFHCHCYPTNTSGGNVRLGLEYFFSCEGQAITTSTIIYITVALPTTAWEQKTLTFADIPAPETIGCQYHFRFFRLGSDALDTATQALAISTIGFHYESDTVGSSQKTVK
jgi:hypothetical protein